jgi:predicted AlkP superfamily phosphohydrolase/phosphomutase
MAEKTLLIGLDGADWRILRPLVEGGVMPRLGDLLDQGTSGDLLSTLPTNSAVAWPSFLTGRNAGKHGVFDFTLRVPGHPTLLAAADSRSIRSETFLAALGRGGRRVGAINIPVTYPPFPVNGFMLGGMFVQEGRPYTYPDGLAAELDERVGGFLPNRIRWRYMLGRFEELLDEAIAVTAQRARVLEYLVTRKEWDVLVQVFVSPDRIQHPLMHVLDPEHPRHDRSLARRLEPRLHTYWQTIDHMLGRARRLIGSDANLIVLSDHGMHGVHKAVYAREMLIRGGYTRLVRHSNPVQAAKSLIRPHLPVALRKRLSRRETTGRPAGSPQGMAGLVWAETRAYVTTGTSQGVYLNLAGRERDGVVDTGAPRERLLDELRDVLLAERDPATGQQVIARVVRGQDAYHGPCADAAPDLLYEPAAGYASAKGARAHLAPYAWFMGDHDPRGILVATGPGVRPGRRIDGAALIDVAPTVLYLAGVPIPEDMDGKVLDLFGDGRLIARRPTYEDDAPEVEEVQTAYTDDEERLVEEQLRSLGYL